MKFNFIITVLFSMLISSVRSQASSHSTLSEVIFAHKAIQSGTVTTNAKQQIRFKPEAILRLKPGDVKTIHLKVLKENVVISQTSYLLESVPEIRNGIKVSYVEDNYYHFTIQDTLWLGNYSYEIDTEDSNGVHSEILSKSK